jgi:hypothetical protein
MIDFLFQKSVTERTIGLLLDNNFSHADKEMAV